MWVNVSSSIVAGLVAWRLVGKWVVEIVIITRLLSLSFAHADRFRGAAGTIHDRVY